jgi:hypothetical protein
MRKFKDLPEHGQSVKGDSYRGRENPDTPVACARGEDGGRCDGARGRGARGERGAMFCGELDRGRKEGGVTCLEYILANR